MPARTSDITDNLLAALHGKALTYGGQSHTTTAEQERFTNIIAGRYPFIVLSGPIVEVLSRAHKVAHCRLYYLVEFKDDTINDDYSTTTTVDPITKVTASVAADLIKLIMSSRTRGGFANNTEWSGHGYYFDLEDNVPVFTVYAQIEVETFINDTDLYLGG
jgi:hypothetical protein